jgi:hypothetical protein
MTAAAGGCIGLMDIYNTSSYSTTLSHATIIIILYAAMAHVVRLALCIQSSEYAQ